MHQTYPIGLQQLKKKIFLIQPSSAASERVFSLLKNSFGPQQDHALQDYMLRHHSYYSLTSADSHSILLFCNIILFCIKDVCGIVAFFYILKE